MCRSKMCFNFILLGHTKKKFVGCWGSPPKKKKKKKIKKFFFSLQFISKNPNKQGGGCGGHPLRNKKRNFFLNLQCIYKNTKKMGGG